MIPKLSIPFIFLIIYSLLTIIKTNLYFPENHTTTSLTASCVKSWRTANQLKRRETVRRRKWWLWKGSSETWRIGINSSRTRTASWKADFSESRQKLSGGLSNSLVKMVDSAIFAISLIFSQATWKLTRWCQMECTQTCIRTCTSTGSRFRQSFTSSINDKCSCFSKMVDSTRPRCSRDKIRLQCKSVSKK